MLKTALLLLILTPLMSNFCYAAEESKIRDLSPQNQFTDIWKLISKEALPSSKIIKKIGEIDISKTVFLNEPSQKIPLSFSFSSNNEITILSNESLWKSTNEKTRMDWTYRTIRNVINSSLMATDGTWVGNGGNPFSITLKMNLTKQARSFEEYRLYFIRNSNIDFYKITFQINALKLETLEGDLLPGEAPLQRLNDSEGNVIIAIHPSIVPDKNSKNYRSFLTSLILLAKNPKYLESHSKANFDLTKALESIEYNETLN